VTLKRSKPRSLSTRLIGLMAGFAVAVLLVLVALALLRERSTILERQGAEGQLFASALAHATASALTDDADAPGHLHRLFAHVAREPTVRKIALLNPDGSVRVAPEGQPDPGLDPALIARALASPDPTLATDLEARRQTFLVRIPSPDDHARVQGLLFFEIDITGPLLAIGHQLWSNVLTGILLVVILSLVLYAFMRRMVVRPVARLAAQSVRLGAGDLSVRSGISPQQAGNAEIYELASAFDSMAARMQRSEAALEQRVRERTRELEIAVTELESFSYAVSHDLRSPLRSIDGFAHMIVDSLGANVSATTRDYVERVRQQAQYMGTLIDNLLTLANVSRAELQRTRVDLSALFADCVASLRRTDPARQVEVQIQPDMEADADPELLRIALVHVLDNAWKFTRDTPRPRIEIGVERKLDRTVAFVRDNGVGFDPAYVERLFTPFRRLHSPREFGGTGIGLAIVQRVCQRHGGKIWAEGATGAGATFYFTLAGHES